MHWKRWSLFVAATVVLVFSTLSYAQGANPLRGKLSARDIVRNNPAALKDNPMLLVAAATETMANVKDFTCIVEKRERVKGKLLLEATVLLKVREKPYSVYAKWIKGDRKGQEALYVTGKYKNKIVAHLSGFSRALGVHEIDPNGSLARSSARHPVNEVGFSPMLKRLKIACDAAKKNGDLKVLYLGKTHLEDGVTAYGLIRVLPRRNNYPCHIMFFYLDAKELLPARLVSLDWDYRLLESYTFKKIHPNQGLTDHDFDRNNKQYDFRLRLLPFFH